MARFTLRLPDSLHEQVAALAEQEGISLNQYIVYALTRQLSAPGTEVRLRSDQERRQDRQEMEALLEKLDEETTPAEMQEFLADRRPDRTQDEKEAVPG